eukprot:TRINITY_DN22785_c0_g3_i1.p2 TRINITY_DN22785_c0_g3~~TRINITY_DN22785_c0_g3_i1.p2  ORF type:complete len:306 (-),score=26.04 TRINITY_DN22785_c0_g3_i1:89-1006(-)
MYVNDAERTGIPAATYPHRESACPAMEPTSPAGASVLAACSPSARARPLAAAARRWGSLEQPVPIGKEGNKGISWHVSAGQQSATPCGEQQQPAPHHPVAALCGVGHQHDTLISPAAGQQPQWQPRVVDGDASAGAVPAAVPQTAAHRECDHTVACVLHRHGGAHEALLGRQPRARELRLPVPQAPQPPSCISGSGCTMTSSEAAEGEGHAVGLGQQRLRPLRAERVGLPSPAEQLPALGLGNNTARVLPAAHKASQLAPAQRRNALGDRPRRGRPHFGVPAEEPLSVRPIACGDSDTEAVPNVE